MENNSHSYLWTIIGAGPAGIAVVGKLIDAGVDPKQIAWIDPDFKVGDFGSRWRSVPSNTKVKLFTKYLNACQAFNYSHCQEDFALNHLDPEQTCDLHYMADPLQWVSNHLKQKVVAMTGFVRQLKRKQNVWEIDLTQSVHYSENVVLTIGSEPKTLPLPNLESIPLTTAFNVKHLATTCNENDTIAVFGSSHSSILVIRNLIESCSVKKVINFYRAPLVYAVYYDDWILHDDTGLKGTTADWARVNIDGKLPAKLQRVLSDKENLEKYLPECTKAIYTIGFEKRSLNVEGFENLIHNPDNGIIAPGLFGLGIAFPQAKVDRFGTLEHKVGLWKFMEYLSNILPIWLRTSTSHAENQRSAGPTVG
jgi:cation diffusion facilitator CzcD-associated flavoprotein CzcO